MSELTESLDLRTGKLFWSAFDRPAVPTIPLDRDKRVEVAILGAGVSGAFVAWHLAKRGVGGGLNDRPPPGMGSTVACTALVQYDLDNRLIDLSRDVGQERAQQAYRVCRDALDWIEQATSELDDTCGLVRRPGLYCAGDDADVASMVEEHEARRSIGIETHWISAGELQERHRVHRPGAILSEASLELDPLRLTAALLRGAITRGAVVHHPTEVADIKLGVDTIALPTTEGPTITARYLVVATGYETPAPLRQFQGKLLSTWAGVTRPIVDLETHWPDRTFIWEHADPYLYARTAGDRVIFGGEDEPFVDETRRDALISRKIATLVRKMQQLKPTLTFEPEFRWAGTFAGTDDAMPYIGPHPEHPHVLMALGYGGNGVTFSSIAGRCLTGLITDDPPPARPANFFPTAR